MLFDPGKFSFVEGLVNPQQFQSLAAIIITHQHPDHIDDEALKTIVDNNPSVILLTNSEIQARLAAKGMHAQRFETGARAIGGFNITAWDAKHAPILGSRAPQNTAYIVDEIFLHPGDSFAQSLAAKAGTRVLALPVMAPWTTELEVAAFAQRMSPKQIIPIHDGYAKAFFLEQRYENFTKHFSANGVQFHWMNKPGDFMEIDT
jgi:L-ascorbate metabolism protein UlaG (beta-lactamase superfamily)